MPSHTLYCFNCKETKPVITIACSGDTHRTPSDTCPKCRQEMLLGYNYKMPKKRDKKGWKQLEEKVQKSSKFYSKFK